MNGQLQLAAVIANVRSQAPGVDAAALSNYLIGAYCPLIADRGAIDETAKTQAVRTFAAQAAKLLYSAAAPTRPIRPDRINYSLCSRHPQFPRRASRGETVASSPAAFGSKKSDGIAARPPANRTARASNSVRLPVLTWAHHALSHIERDARPAHQPSPLR